MINYFIFFQHRLQLLHKISLYQYFVNVYTILNFYGKLFKIIYPQNPISIINSMYKRVTPSPLLPLKNQPILYFNL